MCRAGGRRCPGQYDPAKAAARNAQRRANYAAKKSGDAAGGGGNNGAANALKGNGASPEQIKKNLNTALKHTDETFYHSAKYTDAERMDGIKQVLEQSAEAKANGGEGISNDQAKIMMWRANNVLTDMDIEVKEAGSWAEYKADEAEDAKFHPRATEESIAQANLEAKLAEESYEKEAKRAAEARAMVEKHFPDHLERAAADHLARSQERLKEEQASLNEAKKLAENKEAGMASAITNSPANRVKEAEKKVAQAEERLKDLQDTTKRRLDQAAVTGYPGEAKEMREKIKPSIDAEKAKVKEAKEALKAEKAAEKEAKKAAKAESVTVAPTSKTTARRVIAPESSSNGYEYERAKPSSDEMRRSFPKGVKFKDAVAPGDYVRYMDYYMQVDSYSETDQGITLNEGRSTQMFIPNSELYSGRVLLRSRPGTNDGEDYDGNAHFSAPVLQVESDDDYGSYEDYGSSYGYDEDYAELEDAPEDDVDFSDDLDPADLGDPYGDRDYGDDY